MKFHEIKSDEINLITAYSDSSVSIGNKIITQSSVIFPETLIQNILIDEIDDLKQKKINEIFDYSPEIILIGSVKQQKITGPDQFKNFNDKNISVEVMDLKAACRTFNILISEQRKVALLLIF